MRTGAAGAVVLQTADGFEALRCTGLPETIVYDGVPQGLAARPTLSVRARSARAITATVTLSYLATGLDWQANYVATLSPDGTRLGLFAWLTLANSDETGFANADTQAVAGHLNHQRHAAPAERRRPAHPQLLAAGHDQRHPAPGAGGGGGCRGQRRAHGLCRHGASARRRHRPRRRLRRRMVAQQEELGDLKLYRIPEPVTVAARSQKQVALLQRAGVRVSLVYRQRLFPTDSAVAGPAQRVPRHPQPHGRRARPAAPRRAADALFRRRAAADPARPGHRSPTMPSARMSRSGSGPRPACGPA